MNRVLVIGIDGGDYHLINKWLPKLPNLERIANTGVFNKLESVIPTLSCPSWPCMFTGKTPNELEMYDFVDFHTGSVFNSNDWWDKSMFKAFDDKGVKQCLVNIPVSYPPRKLAHGVLTCGLGTPGYQNAVWTYPKELSQAFTFKKHPLYTPINISKHGLEKENYSRLLMLMADEHELVEKLINSYWNLFFCVFYSLDPTQHYFWRCMDEQHPRHTHDNYVNTIFSFYSSVDRIIGKIESLLPRHVAVVLSDHGFGPYHRGFNVNAWLAQNGCLKYSKFGNSTITEMLTNKLVRILPRAVLDVLSPYVPSEIKERFSTRQHLSNMIEELEEYIDWKETVAYSPSMASGAIFTQTQEQAEQLAIGLSNLKLKTVMNNPICKELPSLFIIGDKDYPMSELSNRNIWLQHAWSGSHTLNGVFFCSEKVSCNKVTNTRAVLEDLLTS